MRQGTSSSFTRFRSNRPVVPPARGALPARGHTNHNHTNAVLHACRVSAYRNSTCMHSRLVWLCFGYLYADCVCLADSAWLTTSWLFVCAYLAWGSCCSLFCTVRPSCRAATGTLDRLVPPCPQANSPHAAATRWRICIRDRLISRSSYMGSGMPLSGLRCITRHSQ